MRALRVNKLRSALTALGIVVGVAAVVCMVSVGAGAQAEVSEKIRTLGANLLLVMPGARNSGGARLESGTQPTLTEEDAAAIRRELVDAQVAAPLLSRSMPLVAANKNWVTLVAGINADYLVAREWQIANGRSFTGDEIASGAKVAIVGSVIIEELFDGRVGIGETFRIGNVPFTRDRCAGQKGAGRSRSQPRRCRVHSAVDREKPRARCRAWHDPRSIGFHLDQGIGCDRHAGDGTRRSRRCFGSGTAFAGMPPAISGSVPNEPEYTVLQALEGAWTAVSVTPWNIVLVGESLSKIREHGRKSIQSG